VTKLAPVFLASHTTGITLNDADYTVKIATQAAYFGYRTRNNVFWENHFSMIQWTRDPLNPRTTLYDHAIQLQCSSLWLTHWIIIDADSWCVVECVCVMCTTQWWVNNAIDTAAGMPSRRGLVAPQNTFLENVIRMCCSQRTYQWPIVTVAVVLISLFICTHIAISSFYIYRSNFSSFILISSIITEAQTCYDVIGDKPFRYFNISMFVYFFTYLVQAARPIKQHNT